jgi:hypothetical protein
VRANRVEILAVFVVALAPLHRTVVPPINRCGMPLHRR